MAEDIRGRHGIISVIIDQSRRELDLIERDLDQGRLPTNVPRVVYKPSTKFLERYGDCLQDACNTAGGIWKATEREYGCYYPEGATTAQRDAIATAYFLSCQDCLFSTVGASFLHSWVEDARAAQT